MAILESVETTQGRALHRDGMFMGLWWSQLASLLGDQLYLVAIVWFVSVVYGVSAAGFGLGLAMSLPGAALGVLAGTLVDRSDRLRVLVMSDLVRAALVAGLAVAIMLTPVPPLILIYGAAALVAAAGVPFMPALQTFLPALALSRPRLVRMDAALLTAQTAMGVLGPFLVATAALLSTPVLLGADAMSFLVSAGAIALIGARPQVRHASIQVAGAHRPPFRQAVKEGIGFVFSHPFLRPQYVVYPFMEGATYAVVFLLPSYVRHELHGSRSTFSFLLAAWALGRVLGFNIARYSVLLRHRGFVLSVNFILQGLAFGAFVATVDVPAAAAALLLVGAPAGAATVSMTTYLQQVIPDAIRGRSFGVLGALARSIMPFGPAALGLVAELAGLRTAMVAVAVTFFATGLFIASRSAVRAVR